MPSQEFTAYKNRVLKGTSGDVAYWRKEVDDPDFIKAQVMSLRKIRHAQNWDTLFRNMSDAGWTRDDVVMHAEEYDWGGRPDIAIALRKAIAQGFTDEMDS